MIAINFLGGAGIGKSTISAELFAYLKKQGVDCELVTEYAKDKVWENATDVLDNQVYVFGKQYHRLQRAAKKTECVITDSSLLNSILYNKDYMFLDDLVIECFNEFTNINIFLQRTVDYNENGRLQTKEEATLMDFKLKRIMYNHDIRYITADPTEDTEALFTGILGRVREALERDKKYYTR